MGRADEEGAPYGVDETQPEIEAVGPTPSGFFDDDDEVWDLSADAEVSDPRPVWPGEAEMAWSEAPGADEDWRELEEAPLGDGPFPVDAELPPAPRATGLADMQAALQSTRGSRPELNPPRPPSSWGLGVRTLEGGYPGAQEVRLQRKRPPGAPPRPTPQAPAPGPGPRNPPARHYPEFAAFMREHGIEVEPVAASAPPVPGTFIPRPPPPPPRKTPEPGELDRLLGLMADGLMIGEDAEGATEIRITLRDDYFAGTELRVSVEPGGLVARLFPPNRDVYRQLASEELALRLRLEERGLKVRAVEVTAP